MLEKILENIGLTEKEAKIYLSTLELGSNPVSKIATKAKLNRVTTYDILEKLTKKGLISSFTRAKVKYFTALEPEKLVTEYQKRIAELEKSLPDLKQLNSQISRPRATSYEGIEGIKQIYADSLTSQSEILNYCATAEVISHWPTYLDDYVAKRIEKNIFLKAIVLDDESGRDAKSRDSYCNRELRLISKDSYDFSGEIMIYDNKVAIISFKDEMIGLLIESPQIAASQRALFSLTWTQLDPLHQITNPSRKATGLHTTHNTPTQSTATPTTPHSASTADSSIPTPAPKTPVLENQESLF